MNIAFVALYNLKDVKKGSGTYHHIYQELCSQNHNVTAIGPLDIRFPFFTRLFRFITKRILLKKYFSYLDPFVGLNIGRAVQKQLKGQDFDIMLTNDYAIAGYSKLKIPIVLWTDSIFPFNYSSNIHPWLKNMSWFSIKFYHIVVKAGLKNISLCIVPGRWHYQEILKYNLIKRDLLSIIPFGANMKDPGEFTGRLKNIKHLETKSINILFVGKDFKLKRLDFAIKVIEELQKVGVNAFLNIVGGKKPEYEKLKDIKKININLITKFHGLIHKDNDEGLIKLSKLYKKSDILLLPSAAEGFGIVYVEAAAYGIPSLGFKTTGVNTAVKNGESGILLDIDKGPSEFTNIILSWIKNPNEYKKLCIGARLHYENNGNWPILIKRFNSYIENKLNILKKDIKEI